MNTEPDYARTETARTLKELFWQHGYANASIEDVVKATGLNRYALYNAYGGKLELFLVALDAYYFERKNIFISNLNDPDTPPLDAIRRVFEFAITEMADRGKGCLMCNVATEGGVMEPKITERVEGFLAEIRLAYAEALTRAQARGELVSSLSPENAADLLITVKLGLGVHAKAGADGPQMLALFDNAMNAITRTSLH